MEMERTLYKIYTNKDLTEVERNNKLFSEIYPLFLNKKTGSFFTPPTIANEITTRCFEVFKSPISIKVLDPACGIGEFLISAANHILSNWIGEKKITPEKELKIRLEIISNSLYGIDIDENVVYFCKIRLLLWALVPIFRKNSINFSEIQRMLSNFEQNIVCADFFKEYQNLDKFDLILCNPPYNAEMTALQLNFFKENYPMIVKNTAAYFYALSEDLIKDHGIMGFVLPKSLAYSKRWRFLKNRILAKLIFIQDISKAFRNVKLEEIIVITSKNSRSQYFTSQYNSTNEILISLSSIKKQDSLILSLRSAEYELYKQLYSIPYKLDDYIIAHRGLNVQKCANKIKDITSNQIFCIGGKEIKPFYLLPSSRVIVHNQENQSLLKKDFGVILGQLANAHVMYPIPHYNLAFAYAPQSSNWLPFDTVININLRKKPYTDYFIDYLLCYLNSDLFSWYLYKIVYSGAIRSTRLDAEYLNKVPFLPILSDREIIFEIFHFFSSSLAMLSDEIHNKYNSTPERLKTLKKLRLTMNILIFLVYLSEMEFKTWINSLKINPIKFSKFPKVEEISDLMELLWSPTLNQVFKKIKRKEQWKLVYIKKIN